MSPGYEKALIDVYIDTVGYLLQNTLPGHNQRLGFLLTAYVSNTSERNTQKWLPSRVPPWNADHPIWQFSRLPEVKAFRASKNKDVCFQFNGLRYSLFLKGLYVNNIQTMDQSLRRLTNPARRATL